MRQRVRAWFHMSAPLHADGEMVLAVIGQSGSMLTNLPGLRHDREVTLAVVKQGGGALAFASTLPREDREVVLAAVQQSWRAIEFASVALRRDPEVWAAAGSAVFSLARLSVPD